MECVHSDVRTIHEFGEHGGMWFACVCKDCGVVTDWVLTPQEAITRMRAGFEWVHDGEPCEPGWMVVKHE